MLELRSIAAFDDNYIWLLVDSDGNQGMVVDPGDGVACVKALQQQGVQLQGILITHHHADHVGGIEACRQAFPEVVVYGPDYTQQAEILCRYDKRLRDADQFSCKLGMHTVDFEVLHTPGHTLDHICYVSAPWLFCGDTLFAGGCGRLFEGDAAQMFGSLQRLAKLPVATQVCCAHEYTQSNLNFALQVEPDNGVLVERLQQVSSLRAVAKSTLPSSIGEELATNPFLRCDQAAVQQAAAHWLQYRCGVSLDINDPVAVFAALRTWKDQV